MKTKRKTKNLSGYALKQRQGLVPHMYPPAHLRHGVRPLGYAETRMFTQESLRKHQEEQAWRA